MRSRIAALYIAITFCFMGLILKIIDINNTMYSDAAKSAHTKTIDIGSSRGKIYDRNLNLLVDETERLIAAVTPSSAAFTLLSEKYGEEEAQEKISSGKPLALETDREYNSELIRTFSIPIRYNQNGLAVHLVGYLDSTGQNGLSGIEKAYNEYLKQNSGTLSVSFEVDATGRALIGLDKVINDNNFNSKAGVVLSIDKNIQRTVESALSESKIKSGCALVMHVDTGEIHAMASVPTYSQSNVAQSLNEENSPLINKSLQSYSVGSIFKPLVAAAALESGISKDFTYECKGSVTVGDVTFKCYSDKKHGKENMTQALENSCNTYFINLLEQIDADYLLEVCRSLGFSSTTEIAQSIIAAKGTLPQNSDLLYPGERANLSFGQGKLLATPIQMLIAYHALATGNYVKPTVIYGMANSSGLVKTESSPQTRKIFSDKTVTAIREMLSSVVENGNAKKAKSSVVKLAGKTGTAQSGIYQDGTEICRTWFAGFYPADNPHYIVVILNENGESGSSDCAPIFKKICEGIVMQQ
ncbi:MAG: penicillin-binding protein 2 [Faecalibacterium sp.]|nr:penicillin-binding protein 2 [Ruminococcus sp.]MCM1393251.1 penicillin-binding protein 2 [Ruminococcus sp.]MCM1486098.1 penicillin-binding protein 2 [Faecalibacterium sp.]